MEVFQLQFVDVHVLLNLNQNLNLICPYYIKTKINGRFYYKEC